MSKKQVKQRKHRILWALSKIILSIIFIIALFIGGFVGYSTLKNGWGVKSLIQTAVGSDTLLEDLDEFQTLILGVSEDIEVALTDTIMVASYNPKTQKAVLLSVPRDTYVGTNKARANSYDKINAIYQQTGAEGVLEKVNKLTGLNIKNYLVISNNALIELVDEIGGVQFNVPMQMDYDSKKQNLHIHLKPGLQKLTGQQAEWLVRFRKNNNGTTYSYEYGNDDFGRMKTQRDFIKEVAKQTLQAKNIIKIGSLIDIVQRNVESNIDWDEVKNYIPHLVEFDTNDIEAVALPGESARIPEGTGLWFFLADEDKTEELIEEIFAVQNGKDIVTLETKSKLNIEVLNGSGTKTNLTKVTDALKAKGYKVKKIDTTTQTAKTTIINKSNIADNVTEDIKTILGAGIVQNSTSTEEIDITILIGSDYE